MSKPKKQPKAASKALESAVGAVVKATPPQPPAAERPREAKTPRLSESLKAQADRLIAARDKKKAPAEPRIPARKCGEPEEETVVFAFRLSAEERELIHKAAGPAKASRFVRALAIAAAKRDEAALRQMLQAVN